MYPSFTQPTFYTSYTPYTPHTTSFNPANFLNPLHPLHPTHYFFTAANNAPHSPLKKTAVKLNLHALQAA